MQEGSLTLQLILSHVGLEGSTWTLRRDSLVLKGPLKQKFLSAIFLPCKTSIPKNKVRSEVRNRGREEKADDKN